MFSDSICWEKWDANGYKISTSKAHQINPNNNNQTVCGLIIPEEGNGIVIENGDVANGKCKKCQQKL